MANFIYFTEEQKEQVRATDLASYLKRNGHKLKRAGSEYEWDSPNGKVTIRGNRWYHQYEETGGYIISFFQRFFDMNFQETMLMLLEEQGMKYAPTETEKEREKKPFELPPANDNMRRMYAYLLKERLLDREVVQYFVHEKLLYEDAEFHNAVFVGVNENGTPVHAHKRGTSSKGGFKGNVESSNPKYSFHYIGRSNRIYVFEAPIDMLSFISLHKENWKDHSYVALCSVATHALLHILKTHPHIREVHPCLDHDKAGIEGDYRIAEQVRELGDYKVKPEQPRYKDWNECIKGNHGLKVIPAANHPGLVRMQKLCTDLVQEFGNITLKEPLKYLQQRYDKLVTLDKKQYMQIAEQSLEMSWIAFLMGKNRLKNMERVYTNEQYAKMLFQLYPPHRDNVGFHNRIMDIMERFEEVLAWEKKDAIVSESEMMEQVRNVMQLSMDCLRLYMYAEQTSQKEEVGESVCLMSQT